VEGSYEHDNEPSGSITCWGVLEQMIAMMKSRKDGGQYRDRPGTKGSRK
jgi:hypothetical protein